MWSLDMQRESLFQRTSESIKFELSRLWFQLPNLKYAEWFKLYIALLEDIASWKLTVNLDLFKKLEQEFKSHQKWIKQNKIANRLALFDEQYRKSGNTKNIQQPIKTAVNTVLGRSQELATKIKEFWNYQLRNQLKDYNLSLDMDPKDSPTKRELRESVLKYMNDHQMLTVEQNEFLSDSSNFWSFTVVYLRK